MNTIRRNHRRDSRQAGFSLVEMSIVLIIIGLIVAAVAAGKDAMQNSQTVRAYKKVVETCISQLQAENTRLGSEPAAFTAVVDDIILDNSGGVKITCPLLASTTTTAGGLTITNANEDLYDMAVVNLHDLPEYNVTTWAAATHTFKIEMYMVGAKFQPAT